MDEIKMSTLNDRVFNLLLKLDRSNDIASVNALLQAAQLGLISRQEVQNNELYIKFMKENNIKRR